MVVAGETHAPPIDAKQWQGVTSVDRVAGTGGRGAAGEGNREKTGVCGNTAGGVGSDAAGSTSIALVTGVSSESQVVMIAKLEDVQTGTGSELGRLH